MGDVIETSLLKLSVPSSLTRPILYVYGSLYLLPFSAAGNFCDDGCKMSLGVILLICFLSRTVLFGFVPDFVELI